ncbi:hypothetical protein CYMTET_3270 [Cymbomonas tetramitiformis]|uniref:Uncharacterized protein n=1 Tax=Cymbomonas tetramitiformis TaxID=36881 RepID=A0AAE0LL76_9CHLO|nr:hypothetical protein CYMTET_3270 [Cymbomonas tetramitiformis]
MTNRQQLSRRAVNGWRKRAMRESRRVYEHRKRMRGNRRTSTSARRARDDDDDADATRPRHAFRADFVSDRYEFEMEGFQDVESFQNGDAASATFIVRRRDEATPPPTVGEIYDIIENDADENAENSYSYSDAHECKCTRVVVERAEAPSQSESTTTARNAGICTLRRIA